MRICRKCHTVIEEEMLFCPECGAKYVLYDTQIYVADGCPVAIIEQNLIKNNDGTSIIILLSNIGNDTINAISLRLKCYDQLGDDLADTIVKYFDLSIENGELFGSDRIIVPVDETTYSFKLIIEKIVLEETGLIKDNFSEFIKSNEFGFLRDKINAQNSELKILKESEEVIEKMGKILELRSELLPIYIKNPTTYQKEMDEIVNKNKNLKNKVINLIIPEKIASKNMCRFFGFAEACSLRSVRFLSADVPKSFSFAHCESLETVILAEGLVSIPSNAFCGCKSLKTINIPETVTKIGESAFKDCQSLETLYIPSSVTNIADNAFLGCHAKIMTEIDVKREQYWLDHAEEKKQLEEELKQIRVTFENSCAEISELNRCLAELKRQREVLPVPTEQQREKIRDEISSLRIKENSLGIFKGKEKKAIRTQIDDLQTKLFSLTDMIAQEKEVKKVEIDTEIANIEEKLTPLNDNRIILQKRIENINTELTKSR